MEAKALRKIKSGTEYNKYFGKALMVDKLIKVDADLSDTMKRINYMLPRYHGQAQGVAKIFKQEAGGDVYLVCKKIWEFIYTHVQYRLDDEGTEQLRTPDRIWADRVKGVDCDDYTILISSILIRLGIPHKLRLAEYENKGYYQHIYVVVPHKGKEIIMDCVKDRFNQEHPYTHIKDTNIKIDYDMNLFELHGIGNTPAKIELKHLILDKWQTQNGDIYLQKLDANENSTYVKIDASENIVEGANAKTLIESDIVQVDDFSVITATDQPTKKSWFEKQVDWVKDNPALATIGLIVVCTTIAGAISFIGSSSETPKPSQNQVSGLGGKKGKAGKNKLKTFKCR